MAAKKKTTKKKTTQKALKKQDSEVTGCDASQLALIDKIAEQMSNAQNAGDMIMVAGAHGLQVSSTGADKVWVFPEPGTTIAGRVLGVDEREEKNPNTGELYKKRDYMVQLQSVAPGDRVLTRGNKDPEASDGREVIRVTVDGETRKFALAELGDVVMLGETYRLRVLADHIGDTVFIKYLGKKSIGNGRKVWEIAVQFLPQARPAQPPQGAAAPGQMRLIAGGDE
jgi:hypothetical protein